MIERKTILDRIEIDRSGNVSIRLGLLLVEGETELACNWHRTSIPVEVPVPDHLAEINAALVAKGEQPIPDDAAMKIVSLVAAMNG